MAMLLCRTRLDTSHSEAAIMNFMPTLPLSPDELLTTTRTVRKRLDLTRPVPLDLVRECLEVALQAPSGSNRQGWHWIVVTDEKRRRVIGDYYRQSVMSYLKSSGAAASLFADDPERSAVQRRVGAAWSYMLAARARGLGTAWTTLHLKYETEISELLGMPPDIRHGALIPTAYYTGNTFQPAPRQPLDEVLHINTW